MVEGKACSGFTGGSRGSGSWMSRRLVVTGLKVVKVEEQIGSIVSCAKRVDLHTEWPQRV